MLSGGTVLLSLYSLHFFIDKHTILGYNHFTEDEDALRIFELYDPTRNKRFPKQLLNFGYFELLKSNVETENQLQWQNYFLQKPLSGNAPDYIKDALQIIDRANMDEEELNMMAHVEYLQSALDNQIAYAKNEREIEIAKRMLKRGTPIEIVAEDTDLDEVTIRHLKKELNNG